MDSISFSSFFCVFATSLDMLIRSLTAFLIVFGVIPCSLLYVSCNSLLRSVSSMARRMESVITSAYMMTCPSAFLAARPIVWIREVSDRRNPSLSASRIATSEISGISRPSRSRLIPTSTSNTSRRISRMISDRSSVSISECRYLTRIPRSFI